MDPPFPLGREYNSTSSHQSFARLSSARSQSLYAGGSNYSNTFSRPNESRSSRPLTHLSSRTILRRDLRALGPLPPTILPTPPSSDIDLPSECLPSVPADPPSANEPFLEPALPRPGDFPSLSNLTPKMMEQLRSNREGSYIIPHIAPAAFLDWQDHYPELLESDAKYEYDGLAERMIIKCMAGHLHDSTTIFFIRRVGDEVRDVGRVCRRQLQIASSTEFTGFAGPYEGLGSRKAPDAYVKVAGTDGFPSVVVESGWAESMEDLLADARLWLLGTGGVTKVCIVVHFQEERAAKPLKAQSDDESVASESNEETTSSESDSLSPEENADSTSTTPHTSENIQPSNDPVTVDQTPFPEEQALLASIDRSTHLNDISRDLLALHRSQKLSQPLLRPFTATFHVYRVNAAHTDIHEECTMTVLPAPTDGVAQSFELPLKDLYGDKTVPANVDPDHTIVFEMDELREDIQDQVPAMEKMRADARALKVLKDVGVVVRETFAAGKKGKGKRSRDEDEWVKQVRRQ